jgi:phosphate starvation-inducible PhoH-like protein
MANRKKKVQVDQDEVYNEIMTHQVAKVSKFKPKTKAQDDYVKLIKEYEITICSGPAGTGKSHCAIATALELIQDKSTKYAKLIITTPAIEADEKIGFLPGTLDEKLSPYMESSFYLIDKVIGKALREKLVGQKMIEVEALGFIRGKNFENCIVFLEEAQNTSPNQMKTFLTRIGENAKFIISGDIEQSDKFKNGKLSGLFDIMSKLRVVEEIGFYDFMSYDIVRNPIIGKILDIYNMPEPKKEVNQQIIIDGKTGIINLQGDVMPLPKDILRKESIFGKIFNW